MNKAELIEAVAASTQLKKSQVEAAINGLVNVITHSLAQGDSVSLSGFGAWAVKDRRQRTGRNPATGEPITISASRVPGFKPGSVLKAAVAESLD